MAASKARGKASRKASSKEPMLPSRAAKKNLGKTTARIKLVHTFQSELVTKGLSLEGLGIEPGTIGLAGLAKPNHNL